MDRIRILNRQQSRFIVSIPLKEPSDKLGTLKLIAIYRFT